MKHAACSVSQMPTSYMMLHSIEVVLDSIGKDFIGLSILELVEAIPVDQNPPVNGVVVSNSTMDLSDIGNRTP